MANVDTGIWHYRSTVRAILGIMRRDTNSQQHIHSNYVIYETTETFYIKRFHRYLSAAVRSYLLGILSLVVSY